MTVSDIPDGIDPTLPILIAGPTASGKSALALRIARAHGGVVVNADALQIYDCWKMLTARPSASEIAEAPHLLYGHVARDAPYSVGHWLREVAAILEAGERPVIVGGTGLYFTALTTGLVDIPPTPMDIRARADAKVAAKGAGALLEEIDQPTRDRIDQRNPARIQRAWEVLRATGRGLADWQADTGPPLLPLSSTSALVLDADRHWLAERIDRRFDLMIEAGALEEARENLPHWDASRPWARAIGAPELVAYLQGKLNKDEAITAAKLASRQYAKRQRTWFRNRMRNWRNLSLP